jgi:thiamine-phosphate diphosphorylase
VTRCLVTDRRRLCPHDQSFAAARRCLVEQAERASAEGIELIQIRERDLEAAELAALVTVIVAATRGTATRVVVNDRLDIALACGAGGVHLRADSVPVDAARALVAWPRAFLVGRSVHTVEEARAASGADYLIAGTVFPSASKPAGAAILGLPGLKAIVEAASAPVLAIGGITLDRIADVVGTGASGIAAIGLFIDSLKPASLT